MDFLDLLFHICLCILTVCILFFIRYIRMWQIDIRMVSSRLERIENKLLRHDCIENIERKQVQQPVAAAVTVPLLIDEKPTSIDMMRYHIQLYYPTLIEEITNFSKEKLTQTDELICMMIKLGYNNKEVASILSITTGSVLTARYRLKRKLQLPDGRQLDAWISQIGNPLVKDK